MLPSNDNDQPAQFPQDVVFRTDHSGKNCVCHKTPIKTENQHSKRDHCKRSLLRTQKPGKLHLITTTSKVIFEGQMVDLSPKGIRFLCKKALMLNEIVKIDSSLFRAIAEINSSQKKVKNGKILNSIGAHFLSISFTDQEGTFFSASV